MASEWLPLSELGRVYREDVERQREEARRRAEKARSDRLQRQAFKETLRVIKTQDREERQRQRPQKGQRGARLTVQGKCTREDKQVFLSPDAAWEMIRELRRQQRADAYDLRPYRCPVHGGFHIGRM